MQKFEIFIKTDKFYWTKNRIIYSAFFFILLIIYINQKFINVQSELIIDIFCGSIVLFFTIVFIWVFWGIAFPDFLNGKLEGFIIFKNDTIEVGTEIYQLSSIKNIEIHNEDYLGKFIYRNRFDFNSRFSNGIKNHVTIRFFSGEEKTYYFQLLKANDFQNVRKELILYCKIGKIDFNSICNVLGEETLKEKENLKNELTI